MRVIGHKHGIPETELVEGSALNIEAADGAFDVVCAFGVLHHVAQPQQAIAEMLRVARRAIFISDFNRYGIGSPANRAIKRAIRAAGLTKALDWVLTRGRGYRQNEVDGVWYAYSLYDSLPQIRSQCRELFLMKTKGEGVDLYRTCSHFAVLGTKAPS